MLPPSSARPWASRSPVQALVDQACDPTLLAPNDMVNIELAEYINRKKANTPREATHALVQYINSRNPNQALLALNVLDHLVKNCGYPIHLQISTKDFLNELVRRFPERPPMVTGRVMGRILELIHEWKNTLCVTSKYKDDLVHIRDMHRLLSYKGYRFKAFDAATAMATSNPNADLKSPEELEQEDRAAKSAKLQELIRRGTPRDLAAAQELMKYLAGAEPEAVVDYEKQTLNELDKVQSKAILLNDMLNNAKEGERVGLEGDVYDQVAAACRGARPKIQKWVEEDTGEHEGLVDRLLLCNDLINNALNRFEAAKKGDWAAANAIAQQSESRPKQNDLISFDAFADDDETPASGGLALPSGAGAAPSTSNPGFTAGGLPLDLFAPSPSASPAPGPSQQAQRPQQNPMDFFNTSSQPPVYGGGFQQQQQQFGQPQQQFGQPQQQFGQQQYQQQQFSAQPQYPAHNQFQAQQQQPKPATPQQAQFGLGGSLTPTATGYTVPAGNGHSATSSPAPAQPQQQQQKKPDAFADLVDLMG